MTHPKKRGWRCYLDPEHTGPCPLWPTFWTRVRDKRTRGMRRMR